MDNFDDKFDVLSSKNNLYELLRRLWHIICFNPVETQRHFGYYSTNLYNLYLNTILNSKLKACGVVYKITDK